MVGVQSKNGLIGQYGNCAALLKPRCCRSLCLWVIGVECGICEAYKQAHERHLMIGPGRARSEPFGSRRVRPHTR